MTEHRSKTTPSGPPAPSAHGSTPRSTPGPTSPLDTTERVEVDSDGIGETKRQLLDAAEDVIAEHGVAGASLRAITKRARANLAAVNYHFGSKLALVRALVARRLRPVNAERLRLLDAAEARAGDDPPALVDLVRAFVGPVVRYGAGHPVRRQRIARIFGRALSQQDTALRGMLIEELQEVILRFGAAFGRALPHLDRVDLMWRIHFMVGSMAHSLAAGDLIAHVTQGLCDPDDTEGQVERLTSFLCAGLAAPAPSLESE